MSPGWIHSSRRLWSELLYYIILYYTKLYYPISRRKNARTNWFRSVDSKLNQSTNVTILRLHPLRREISTPFMLFNVWRLLLKKTVSDLLLFPFLFCLSSIPLVLTPPISLHQKVPVPSIAPFAFLACLSPLYIHHSTSSTQSSYFIWLYNFTAESEYKVTAILGIISELKPPTGPDWAFSCGHLQGRSRLHSLLSRKKSIYYFLLSFSLVIRFYYLFFFFFFVLFFTARQLDS